MIYAVSIICIYSRFLFFFSGVREAFRFNAVNRLL